MPRSLNPQSPSEIEKEPLAKIDYVDVVDFDTITPVETLTGSILVAIAVYIGKTRLIDNFIVENRRLLMQYNMLKGKIHRAVVKQADLNYVGSITVDTDLLEAAGILEYELVQIVDVENGNRFETYTIAGEAGSGMICLNGAAARQVAVGDHVILMCYAQMTPEEAKNITESVFVDADNHIARVTNYEKHGKLTDDFIGA